MTILYELRMAAVFSFTAATTSGELVFAPACGPLAGAELFLEGFSVLFDPLNGFLAFPYAGFASRAFVDRSGALFNPSTSSS